ncbi:MULTISPECIES: PspA/IM30 family protein [unclassified Nitrosospira]|uniref:PspA/IM30 family protein n=1 Tax=unclassified Nitrosospira TaxID=2609267 RepID=UPI000D326319|nr:MULTISPECIES: cell envelope integrity protein TolA [unclassified Nitrosospira]PTR17424.1 hypothetical protein C8R31_101587 [Nitrosospira sp. Nsp2]WON74270.1 hypothetical protein R5L00_01915 [Nitrosospira sp. Is2]
MFGSSILEAAIALIFVYLLLSLMCTALNEGIASLIQKRGKNLFEGIKNLLNDPTFTGLAQQVYNHGLVGGISQNAANPSKPTRLPSYMSSANFSLALLDILGTRGIISAEYGDLLAAAESADDAYEEALRAAKGEPGNPQLAEAVEAAKGAQERARAALEAIGDKAKAAYEQAVQATNANPGDSDLARRALEARNTSEKIRATIGMLDARRAAVASAKNPKELRLLLLAGNTLKQALALGRSFAAQYPDPLGNIEAALKRMPEGHTKETLLVLVDKTRREVAEVEHQAEAFRRNLEDWFNDAMDRVGGWYKRWTQRVLLILATLLVLVSNADTVMLVQQLSTNDALRASLVAAAQEAVKTVPPPGGAEPSSPEPDSSAKRDNTTIQYILQQTQSLQLPVGWSLDPKDPRYFQFPEFSLDFAGWAFYKVFGLLISILAISMGAPFWFDTLSKFVNLRSAGTPPGETRKSAPSPERS